MEAVMVLERSDKGVHLIFEDQTTRNDAVLKAVPKDFVASAKGDRKGFFLTGMDGDILYHVYGTFQAEGESGWKKLSVTFTHFRGSEIPKSKLYHVVLSFQQVEQLLKVLEDHWQ